MVYDAVRKVSQLYSRTVNFGKGLNPLFLVERKIARSQNDFAPAGQAIHRKLNRLLPPGEL